MNESITLAINAISVTMKLLHWFWRHFNITILYPCRLSRIEHPVKSQKLVNVTLFVFGIPLVSVKKNRAICSTFEWNIAQPVFCRCPVYDASAVGGRADRYFFFSSIFLSWLLWMERWRWFSAGAAVPYLSADLTQTELDDCCEWRQTHPGQLGQSGIVSSRLTT